MQVHTTSMAATLEQNQPLIFSIFGFWTLVQQSNIPSSNKVQNNLNSQTCGNSSKLYSQMEQRNESIPCSLKS